jgi:dTDP-4-amino-4,6-dideoxygalactose transaminase
MSRTNELAILGGEPAFTTPLHVGQPYVGDRGALVRRIESALDRRWLTNDGPLVAEFEERIAALLGTRNCVATCNATSAMQIVARSLDLRGEVIVPALTFVATAHAFEWLGIEPIFCDVDRDTYTIDPAAAERLVSDRTTAILGVHLWGRPCDVPALIELADRHRLRLIFDAAHAFGASFDAVALGNFGAAEVLSFHATKVCSAAEGGAVVTNDDGLAKRARSQRSFGFAGYDDVADRGTNAKMSELSAAMGLTSLDALDSLISANARNYGIYRDALAAVPGLALIDLDIRHTPNYHHVVVEVAPDQAGVTRDELQAALWAENVLARRYFYPGCHRMEPYASRRRGRQRLPVTEFLVERLLSLPTGANVTVDEVRRVGELIRRVVEQASDVRRHLGSSLSPVRWTSASA